MNITNGNGKLRAIRVTYSNGEVITTSMAAHLTDQEMLDYFAIGKTFNIGMAYDRLAVVTKREILK